MNILIINNWATNKGDRAVLQFLLNRLTDNKNISNIYVSTSSPELLSKIYISYKNVTFIPFSYNLISLKNDIFSKVIRRISYILFYNFFYKILRYRVLNNIYSIKGLNLNKLFLKSLINSDIIIGTGGHHITTMRNIDCISPLAFDIGVCLLTQKPIYLWSQSVGPLEFKKEINYDFIHKMLSKTTEIYLREESSLNLLNLKGWSDIAYSMTFDSVFGLYKDLKLKLRKVESKTIGIAIFNANKRSSRQLDDYIKLYAKICKFLKNKNYAFKFFPMESEKNEIKIIHKIIELSEISKVSQIINTDISTQDHILEVSSCEYFIGHKTHSIIFALITNTPLLAISYHIKTNEFMKMYELSNYILYENDIIEKYYYKFNELESNYELIRKNMEKYNNHYSEIVIDDFNKIINGEN